MTDAAGNAERGNKTMAQSVNRVVLLGTVGKYGVQIRYAPSGAVCASFSLVLTEETVDHKYFSTVVPCEVWGRKAEQLSTELHPGQRVCFEGKVTRRKRGEAWDFAITGFDCTPITSPALEVAP